MKKSSLVLIIILIVLAFVVLGAALYYNYYLEKKKDEELMEQKRMENEEQQREALELEAEEMEEAQEEALRQTEEEEEPSVTEKIEYKEYKAELEDVRGKESKGEAIASYSKGNYGLKVTFEDLEDPKEKFFYEGWVVRKKPYRVLSTGKVEKENDKYVNKFSSTEDLTDHELYVLTIEPDDDDPKPADHVLEGEFIENKKQ